MVTYNPAKFIGYVVYGYIRYMVEVCHVILQNQVTLCEGAT